LNVHTVMSDRFHIVPFKPKEDKLTKALIPAVYGSIACGYYNVSANNFIDDFKIGLKSNNKKDSTVTFEKFEACAVFDGYKVGKKGVETCDTQMKNRWLKTKHVPRGTKFKDLEVGLLFEPCGFIHLEVDELARAATKTESCGLNFDLVKKPEKATMCCRVKPGSRLRKKCLDLSRSQQTFPLESQNTASIARLFHFGCATRDVRLKDKPCGESDFVDESIMEVLGRNGKFPLHLKSYTLPDPSNPDVNMHADGDRPRTRVARNAMIGGG